eukprot:jgi/Mesen1/8343/ME000462S07790
MPSLSRTAKSINSIVRVEKGAVDSECSPSFIGNCANGSLLHPAPAESARPEPSSTPGVPGGTPQKKTGRTIESFYFTLQAFKWGRRGPPLHAGLGGATFGPAPAGAVLPPQLSHTSHFCTSHARHDKLPAWSLPGSASSDAPSSSPAVDAVIGGEAAGEEALSCEEELGSQNGTASSSGAGIRQPWMEEGEASPWQGGGKEEKKRKEHALANPPGGLFGHRQLATAGGFHVMAREAVARSEELLEEVTTRTPPSLHTLQLLDDISDALCQVLDSAELCRHTHPDREYVAAANQVFVELSQYVQKLNVSRSLYDALVAAMDSGTLGPEDEEPHRVAAMLRLDFERGGVHLPPDGRAKVEELNNSATRLTMQFGHNIAVDQSYVDIHPASRLRSVPNNIRALLAPAHAPPGGSLSRLAEKGASRGLGGGLRVTSDPLVSSTVLKWVADSEVRRQVYVMSNSSPHKNLETLGYQSYADFTTRQCLAGSPETVATFLRDLSQQVRAKADQELGLLGEYKRQQEGRGGGGEDLTVHAWDRPFYTGQAKARAHSLDARVIAAYFSLEACVRGLGVLLRALFRVDMRECRAVAVGRGELWAADVRKFSLTHLDELGHIYLDLYPRPSKYTHAAHFNIRCGRQLADGSYQLPLVALVCNFPRPIGGGPCLLNHAEVETLFHEFGHALHSLLSRTTFAHHHSSGDPIPERLVASLRQSKQMFAAMDLQNQVVYSLTDQAFFGRQPPAGSSRSTTAVLAEIQNEHSNIRHVEGTHWQARFSHLLGYGAGARALSCPPAMLPPIAAAAPGGTVLPLRLQCHVAFSHASGGAVGLSASPQPEAPSGASSGWSLPCQQRTHGRLWSARAANCGLRFPLMWETHFAADPLSPEAGQVLRDRMLRHGGARDPALILADVLGPSDLQLSPSGGLKPSVTPLLKDSGLLS